MTDKTYSAIENSIVINFFLSVECNLRYSINKLDWKVYNEYADQVSLIQFFLFVFSTFRVDFIVFFLETLLNTSLKFSTPFFSIWLRRHLFWFSLHSMLFVFRMRTCIIRASLEFVKKNYVFMKSLFCLCYSAHFVLRSLFIYIYIYPINKINIY